MRVIGTAGHVDHGKSTLVQALTGTHPDRLKEEQARQMTIELGFAWLILPDGEEVGIVDVPGHRDFIENMLAGVGGMDAVLFVVAADEGVMPQTREHLAILDLLKVPAGIIVMTKVDLVDELEWLSLVEGDVRQAVAGTILEGAPMVRVSARSGIGLEQLISTLSTCLNDRPQRPNLQRPRLSVDRVFSITGFGTVVTGTLMDGELHSGEDVEFLPVGLHGRVRGLQSHRRKEMIAVPGSRTAVNVSGLEVEQIQRGQVLVHPGTYIPVQRLTAHFRLLRDASTPLRHNRVMKFFLGASEVEARVRLLGVEELLPGQEGWLQLELRQPVVVVRGDRYILRRPSPGETMGGGEVIDPQPQKRHKRFDRLVMERLEALRRGTPVELLFQAGLALGPSPLKEWVTRASLAPNQAQAALDELFESRQALLLENGKPTPQADLLAAIQVDWQARMQRILGEVGKYHRVHPLRCGIPREELKSRLLLQSRIFQAALIYLIEGGDLVEIGMLLRLTTHEVQLNLHQKARLENLVERFRHSPYAPPTYKECQADLGVDLFNAVLEMGYFVVVSPEVVFHKQDYEILCQAVLDHCNLEGTLTVAQFRDQFNTSRRYALAFLEHLDAVGVTVREGDNRRLK
jgi:selenocysteine-specific elongation factor